MDILELLSPERVVELQSVQKADALREIVSIAARSDAVIDRDQLEQAIFDREEILSTGIGLGLAVPHAKITSVSRFVAAIGIARAGIEYGSMDDEPVRIVVLIAGPEGDNKRYLQILSRFTLVLRREENRQAILDAPVPEGVLAVLREAAAG